MSSKRRTASLVAAVMGAFILAPIQPPIAASAAKATAFPNQLSISSGSIQVFAADSYTATNPFAGLTTPVVNGRAKIFYIHNQGDFELSRLTMTLVLPSGTAIANFRRCANNVTFISNDVCGSGSYTSVSISANTATTLVLNLPPNSYYAFQIRQNKNTNMLVNVSASTAHITDAGITNS